MKYILFLTIAALVAACRNDAITYMHVLDPNARCTAISTSWTGNFNDKAVCVSGHDVYNCDSSPGCSRVGAALVEAK